MAGRDVVLLPVHNDGTTGGDDGHEAMEAARTLHRTIGVVVIEHDTGKTAAITRGPSPLHEAGGRLCGPVQGVAIDVA